MSCYARIVGFALGAGCVALARGEEPPLPGIFAPRPPSPPNEPPLLLARRSANSEKVSALITQRVLERAKEFDVSTLPIAPRPGGTESKVIMEKVVVSAAKKQSGEVEEMESPALRFLRTGRLFETANGYQGNLRLLPVSPPGALPKEPVMRVEITIQKKF